MSFTYDPHFIKFRKSLEGMLSNYSSTRNTEKDEFTKKQKSLVETLVKKEKQFRLAVKKHRRGRRAYSKFISFILDEKKNILAARPYFRERQTDFSQKISPAIKSRNVNKMFTFNINYPFIDFIMSNEKWGKSSDVFKIATEIKKIREEIILQNMPLAISRATLFKKKTPENHLNFMDLNQISFEGLINAVDKFVLPYTTVYRSVIIGRISGDLIENYSETMMHFYPSDKRKIYRANKINKGQDLDELNFETLAENVNLEGPKLESPANGVELQGLMAAVSPLSLDVPMTDDSPEAKSFSSNFVAPETVQPDYILEDTETKAMLQSAYSSLSPIEMKILKMKGFNL